MVQTTAGVNDLYVRRAGQVIDDDVVVGDHRHSAALADRRNQRTGGRTRIQIHGHLVMQQRFGGAGDRGLFGLLADGLRRKRWLLAQRADQPNATGNGVRAAVAFERGDVAAHGHMGDVEQFDELRDAEHVVAVQQPDELLAALVGDEVQIPLGHCAVPCAAAASNPGAAPSSRRSWLSRRYAASR